MSLLTNMLTECLPLNSSLSFLSLSLTLHIFLPLSNNKLPGPFITSFPLLVNSLRSPPIWKSSNARFLFFFLFILFYAFLQSSPPILESYDLISPFFYSLFIYLFIYLFIFINSYFLLRDWKSCSSTMNWMTLFFPTSRASGARGWRALKLLLIFLTRRKVSFFPLFFLLTSFLYLFPPCPFFFLYISYILLPTIIMIVNR